MTKTLPLGGSSVWNWGFGFFGLVSSFDIRLSCLLQNADDVKTKPIFGVSGLTMRIERKNKANLARLLRCREIRSSKCEVRDKCQARKGECSKRCHRAGTAFGIWGFGPSGLFRASTFGFRACRTIPVPAGTDCKGRKPGFWHFLLVRRRRMGSNSAFGGTGRQTTTGTDLRWTEWQI